MSVFYDHRIGRKATEQPAPTQHKTKNARLEGGKNVQFFFSYPFKKDGEEEEKKKRTEDFLIQPLLRFLLSATQPFFMCEKGSL